MSNRSTSVSAFQWLGLAIRAGTRFSLLAGGGAYLPAIGPTPLRYHTQAAPVVEVAPKASEPVLVAPAPVPPTDSSTNKPAPSVTIPDVLRSLFLTPLWSALGEGAILNPLANAGFVMTQNPTAASTPVVTTEMLVDFFRQAEPTTAGTTNNAVTTGQAWTAPVFVLPSSSATYRTQ